MDESAKHRLPLRALQEFLARHFEALAMVVMVVVPLIVRTGRRPVILSRFSGMGDIICTVPAVQELRKRHPGTAFIYNCHPDFATIPRLTGIAEKITSLKWIGLVGYWYRFLLGGYYHFAHGDDQPDRGCQEPMVAEFCRQFDLPVADEHPSLPVTAEARKNVLELLRKRGLNPHELVLIHPGPSWPVREWAQENWEHLVRELRERGYTDIGQLGVSRYLNFGKVALPGVSGTVSLLDELSVEECIAAIALAKLFIGIDSGLLHIAAAVGAPSVGMFGMSLPEYRFSRTFREGFVVNRIECAGCEHRKPRLHWVTGCPFDIKCMKTLSVDRVLQACLAKLPPIVPPSIPQPLPNPRLL